MGILVDAVDYESAVEQIIEAAKGRRGFAVSTASVHTVMEGVLNHEHKFRLNHLDLLTPDGQPVRWALKILHGVELADRVYGPNLTMRLCERAEKENFGLYFYGNTKEVLWSLRDTLCRLLEACRFRVLYVHTARGNARNMWFEILRAKTKAALLKRVSRESNGTGRYGFGRPAVYQTRLWYRAVEEGIAWATKPVDFVVPPGWQSEAGRRSW